MWEYSCISLMHSVAAHCQGVSRVFLYSCDPHPCLWYQNVDQGRSVTAARPHAVERLPFSHRRALLKAVISWLVMIVKSQEIFPHF